MAQAGGPGRVLTMSTLAFTLMFAVWLMFGILGKPIQQEFRLTDVELSWISAVAVLNGSLWRLPAGMLADRIGGRKVMTFLLATGAVASWAVSRASSYPMVLVLAFLVGFVGNSFSVGIAWNSAWFARHRQGFALGLFGAGNVGASGTKFIGPVLITATAGSTYAFGVSGGWRLVPVIYAVLLAVMAVLTWVVTPHEDRMPGASKSIAEMLVPLRRVQVWRFSLYYVVVFGAYVALSAVMPAYYIDNFGVDLAQAGLLTATFIFPASLLRPLGGWASDRWGARRRSTIDPGWPDSISLATWSLMLINSVLAENQLKLPQRATLRSRRRCRQKGSPGAAGGITRVGGMPWLMGTSELPQ